jgi:putative PIN family toxin of toxin-antitoxin system
LPGDREDFLEKLMRVAVWTTIPEQLVACRAAGDDKFLETAILGRGNCIVSGDQDLLVLDPFRGIPILTPAAYLERVT